MWKRYWRDLLLKRGVDTMISQSLILESLLSEKTRRVVAQRSIVRLNCW